MRQTKSDIRLPADWLALLHDQFDQPYMLQLGEFLRQQKSLGKVIFPPTARIFAAFDHLPLASVRVVMLGQDPYHGPGQAHGLCFSVPPGIKPPPSLVNIYKELHADIGFAIPDHGCLEPWTRRGILLLNSVLTVEQGLAGSHQGRGWECFTDTVISRLDAGSEHLVFMLWGAYAQRKGAMIDRSRHLVLEAPHPSPLSAHRGFLGCRHFSQANAYLQQHGRQPVDWSL